MWKLKSFKVKEFAWGRTIGSPVFLNLFPTDTDRGVKGQLKKLPLRDGGVNTPDSFCSLSYFTEWHKRKKSNSQGQNRAAEETVATKSWNLESRSMIGDSQQTWESWILSGNGGAGWFILWVWISKRLRNGRDQFPLEMGDKRFHIERCIESCFRKVRLSGSLPSSMQPGEGSFLTLAGDHRFIF